MKNDITRVAILGAAGRMGGTLIRCAAAMPGLAVTVAIEQPGHEAIGRDAGESAGIGANGIAITDDPRAASGADVLIDFTFHEASPGHAELAAELGVAIVVGTTGLTDAETAAVARPSESIPVMLSPNMSLGVNLLFALVARAAASLGMDYDVEIVETHHNRKKDAPSGTALQLGERVASARNQDLEQAAVHGRHGITGERTPGSIGFHAVRAGDVVGDHRVLFATENEYLELGHHATSRDTFATGALRAARWLKGRTPGLYEMKDVLGL